MRKRLRVFAAILGLTIVAGAALAEEIPELLIMGGPNHDEFLGCLTCSDTDPRSVWNTASRYGWGNKFGTWNPFGPHRNRFSVNSACNQYSISPPKLVDRRGNNYGQLSINKYLPDGTCGPNGNEQLCMALRVMCASE